MTNVIAIRRWLVVAIAAFLVTPIHSVAQATVVIDNGLSPPNPANVIDATNSYPLDSVEVYADGNTPTNLAVVSGGYIGGDLSLFNRSTADISGGTVNGMVNALDSARINMSGGTVSGTVNLGDDAWLGLSGGTVGGVFFSSGIGAALNMSDGIIVGDLATVCCTYADEIRMHITRSHIGGNVYDDSFNGNFTAMSNVSIGGSYFAGSETKTSLSNVSIGGDFTLSGNETSFKMENSIVHGDASFSRSLAYTDVSDTDFLGGLTVIGLYGDGLITIERGSFAGNVIYESGLKETLNDFGFGLVLVDAPIAGALIGDSATGTSVLRGSVGQSVEALAESIILLDRTNVARDVIASAMATITIRDATIDGILSATDTSRIEIFGDSFELDGIPIGLGLLSATSGELTGMLNGDSFSYDVLRETAATIVLIPEPSTILLLGLGLLGLRTVHRRG